MENNNQVPIMYTDEQLMSRLKFFIGICLSLTLFGIVFVVLYSLIFVTQPLNAISPIDQKFFELIIPIATFLTGTLSGIMLASPGDKEAQAAALKAANSGWDRPPHPTTPNGGFSNGGATASTTGFASGASTFGAPSSGGFGATSGGFGSTPAPAAGGFGGGGFGGAPTAVSTPAFTAPSATATVDVATGYGGKPAPVQPQQPII